jgi:hypothetical protein
LGNRFAAGDLATMPPQALASCGDHTLAWTSQPFLPLGQRSEAMVQILSWHYSFIFLFLDFNFQL